MLTRLLLASTLAGTFVSSAAADPNDLSIDLGRGPVTIHVPDSYDSGQPAPLILLLHGYSITGANQEAYMKFLPLAETYGFLYAHPDGLLDQTGNPYWNGTDACCDFFGTGVDDAGYLRALIDEVKWQLNVDGRRVYLVGHSNGGFMAYRMACEHADVIAAVATLAGATYFDPGACNPTQPVSVLQVHGTLDTVIPYAGGVIGSVAFPGAVGSVERWASYDGCSPVVDSSAAALDLVSSIPGAESTVTRYVDACAPSGMAELWTMVGADHSPSLTIAFAETVVQWFYAHPEPGLDIERYCSPAEINSSGLPGMMSATGSDALSDNDLTLTANRLPAAQFGYFVASRFQGFIPGAGGSQGNLCLSNPLTRFSLLVQNSGPTGTISISVDLTALPVLGPILVGEKWSFQAWFRDQNPTATSNFTDAIAIRFL
jgi:polyhydroxybutyrate depolymerase